MRQPSCERVQRSHRELLARLAWMRLNTTGTFCFSPSDATITLSMSSVMSWSRSGRRSPPRYHVSWGPCPNVLRHEYKHVGGMQSTEHHSELQQLRSDVFSKCPFKKILAVYIQWYKNITQLSRRGLFFALHSWPVLTNCKEDVGSSWTSQGKREETLQEKSRSWPNSQNQEIGSLHYFLNVVCVCVFLPFLSSLRLWNKGGSGGNLTLCYTGFGGNAQDRSKRTESSVDYKEPLLFFVSCFTSPGLFSLAF